MKRKHIIIALIACTVIGFLLGLAFEGFIGKAYAETSANTTDGLALESAISGSARSADYEIVNIYGHKYIIFSSGSDIEVLEY